MVGSPQSNPGYTRRQPDWWSYAADVKAVGFLELNWSDCVDGGCDRAAF